MIDGAGAGRPPTSGDRDASPLRVTVEGEPCPVGRIFCIGRNYRDHVKELGNRSPTAPVIFLKPASCLLGPGCEIPFPRHGSDLQHEVELVLQLGSEGHDWERVAALGLGLDLTLRDLQSQLKQAGLPWEPAKAFEASAPLGELVARCRVPDPESLRFECRVNGKTRQSGRVRDMIFSVPELLRAIGSIWQLRPGDLVFTGTPSGVGPLRPGDRVTIAGAGLGEWSWTVGEL